MSADKGKKRAGPPHSSSSGNSAGPSADTRKRARGDDHPPWRDGGAVGLPNSAEPPTGTAFIKSTAGVDASGDDECRLCKIFNLNVNGVLKAFSRNEKRLAKLLANEDPDIVVFTETHYDPQAPMKRKEDGMAGYQAFRARYKYHHVGVNPSGAGSAGLAVYSKHKPLSMLKSGLPTYPTTPASTKGRFLMFEYPAFFLVAVYVPNSGHSDKADAIAARKVFDKALREYVHDLDAKKPVILVGDQNVAPSDDDVHIASGKHKAKPVSGCILPHEREGWHALLNPDDEPERRLVDVWRELHPDEKKVFTHVGADGKPNFHAGYRLDHFVISQRLLKQVEACEILSPEIRLSDHVPITMSIRISMT